MESLLKILVMMRSSDCFLENGQMDEQPVRPFDHSLRPGDVVQT